MTSRDTGGAAALASQTTTAESGSHIYDKQVYWEGAQSFLDATPVDSRGLRPALFHENEVCAYRTSLQLLVHLDLLTCTSTPSSCLSAM